MYKLKFKDVDHTHLKYSPHLQLSQITNDTLKYKISVDNIDTIQVKSYQDLGSHYEIKIVKPIYNRVTWYVFDQHVDVIDVDVKTAKKGNVNLDVPYLSQRDNRTRPHQTCNMTSAAMVLKYYGLDRGINTAGRQLEDALTHYCVSKWGHNAIYYHNRIVDTLRHYGVKSIFSTTTKFSDIKAHLASGHPVIYSGKFTGSGHIIVLRGYDDTGFYVNDPWGEWFSWGYDGNKTGENLHYSYNMIQRLSYSGSHAGWAHLCTSIDKPPDKKVVKLKAVDKGIPKAAIDIISEFEGCHEAINVDGETKYRAYADPLHGWNVGTIGIGTTKYEDGSSVKQGDVISRKRAEELLMYELEEKCKPQMEKIPNWKHMNDNQRSALYSFAYNLGAYFYKGRNFKSITKVCDYRDKWNNEEWVTAQFIKYRNPGSNVEAGLKRRRIAEAKLFCNKND